MECASTLLLSDVSCTDSLPFRFRPTYAIPGQLRPAMSEVSHEAPSLYALCSKHSSVTAHQGRSYCLSCRPYLECWLIWVCFFFRFFNEGHNSINGRSSLNVLQSIVLARANDHVHGEPCHESLLPLWVVDYICDTCSHVADLWALSSSAIPYIWHDSSTDLEWPTRRPTWSRSKHTQFEYDRGDWIWINFGIDCISYLAHRCWEWAMHTEY